MAISYGKNSDVLRRLLDAIEAGDGPTIRLYDGSGEEIVPNTDAPQRTVLWESDPVPTPNGGVTWSRVSVVAPEAPAWLHEIDAWINNGEVMWEKTDDR